MRLTQFKLWIICSLALPILCLMQLLQGLFGDTTRSQRMAEAVDACANSLFGGLPTMTISARTGLGVREGLRWAKDVAPIIDFCFGAGHCSASAESYLKERE